jgi:hypothetical protein
MGAPATNCPQCGKPITVTAQDAPARFGLVTCKSGELATDEERRAAETSAAGRPGLVPGKAQIIKETILGRGLVCAFVNASEAPARVRLRALTTVKPAAR